MKWFLLLALAAGASLRAGDESRIFTGMITDSRCKLNHKIGDIMPDSQCVLACVNNGARYVLADGNHVFDLSDQLAPTMYAAKRVNITGVVIEGKLQVQKIALVDDSD